MNTTALQINNTALMNRADFTQELYTRWLNYLDTTPKTVLTYTKAIKQFFYYLQENNITAPRREDIIAYRESLKAEHKPTTIQTYITTVKLFFRWLSQEELYPNVADHIKGAKLDTAFKKDYLTSRQAGMLFKEIETSSLIGLRDRAIVSLMLTTGLRTISVSEANIEDIRTAGDSLVLYYLGKGHSQKTLYVKLTEHTEEAIRAYLTARGTADPAEPLFTSTNSRNKGGRMETGSISRVIKNRMRNVGLNSDKLTAHSLRHTTATLALLNGATLEETQQLLAHRSINTTMVYSHALDRAKNNSEARIDTAIFG